MIAAAAVLFSLVAEGAAGYAVVKLLSGAFADGERQAASILIFVAVSVAGFGVPRVLDAIGVPPRRAMLIALLATFVFVYLSSFRFFHGPPSLPTQDVFFEWHPSYVYLLCRGVCVLLPVLPRQPRSVGAPPLPKTQRPLHQCRP